MNNLFSDTDLCHPNNCHQNQICHQSGKDFNCLSGLFKQIKTFLFLHCNLNLVNKTFLKFDENGNFLMVVDYKILGNYGVYELNLQVNAIKILVLNC